MGVKDKRALVHLAPVAAEVNVGLVRVDSHHLITFAILVVALRFVWASVAHSSVPLSATKDWEPQVEHWRWSNDGSIFPAHGSL